MHCPAILPLAAAQDADLAGSAIPGFVKQDLHPSTRNGRLAAAALIRKDQGVLHPEVIDTCRRASLDEAGRRSHGTVERTRRDQAAEDAVVVEPGRIRRVDFRIESDLAVCGIVACAQKRMTGSRPSPPGRLDPVALALERVGRQGNAPAALAGEQPGEGERDSRRVSARNRLHESASGTWRRPRLVPGRPPEAR